MAQRLLRYIPGPAQIRKTATPSTDSIRRAENMPSIDHGYVLAQKHLYLSLKRFGRNVEDRIHGFCRERTRWRWITLDLRGNGGGDPERMLKVAALFAPHKEKVFHIQSPDGGRRYFSIPKGPKSCGFQKLHVLIGRETASSAEILAYLLKTHAGAALLGQRTFGKDFLYRLVPLDQHWRLYLPAEKISLPTENLALGIAADGPVPADFLRQPEAQR